MVFFISNLDCLLSVVAVSVLCLSLTVSWVRLQCATGALPGHSYLLFILTVHLLFSLSFSIAMHVNKIAFFNLYQSTM